MSVSAAASQRIRRFSTGVGVLGAAAVVASVTLLVGATVARDAQTVRQTPWLQETIVEAQRTAGSSEWSAGGSARVTLPEALRGVPVGIELTSEGSIDVYLGRATGPTSSPAYLGGAYRGSTLPFASYADSELWIVAPASWSATLTPLDAETVIAQASGDADAVLVVGSDVSSAHLSWVGDGWLRVVARTRDGYQRMHSSEDEGDGAVDIAWTPSEFAVFEIYAYDGVRWTLTLDDPISTDEEATR